MTDKDIYPLGIIQRVHDHTILQREAARLLELTVRQVQRVLVVKLIRTRCRGMSPTGAWRLLSAGFGLSISKETVRKLMIAESTWVARPKEKL